MDFNPNPKQTLNADDHLLPTHNPTELTIVPFRHLTPDLTLTLKIKECRRGAHLPSLGLAPVGG